jgi:hypothetical protein
MALPATRSVIGASHASPSISLCLRMGGRPLLGPVADDPGWRCPAIDLLVHLTIGSGKEEVAAQCRRMFHPERDIAYRISARRVSSGSRCPSLRLAKRCGVWRSRRTRSPQVRDGVALSRRGVRAWDTASIADETGRRRPVLLSISASGPIPVPCRLCRCPPAYCGQPLRGTLDANSEKFDFCFWLRAPSAR